MSSWSFACQVLSHQTGDVYIAIDSIIIASNRFIHFVIFYPCHDHGYIDNALCIFGRSIVGRPCHQGMCGLVPVEMYFPFYRLSPMLARMLR